MKNVRSGGKQILGLFRLSYVNTLFFLIICFKLLLFDFLWGYETSFSSFSFLQTYINKMAVAACLLLAFMLSRKVAVVVYLLLDLFLIANLMYFRTYFTAIPLDSYGLLDNLQDFSASVFDSACWADLLFPLSTLTGYVILRLKKDKLLFANSCREWRNYGLLLLISCSASFLYFVSEGGILQQNKELQNANYFIVRTPIFTLFGSLYCEYKENANKEDLSVTKNEIKSWLDKRHLLPVDSPTTAPVNCVVILAESLESWVLEKEVEGQEITPCLNRLLKKQIRYMPLKC